MTAPTIATLRPSPPNTTCIQIDAVSATADSLAIASMNRQTKRTAEFAIRP
jgi:hypothetical protein